MARRSSARLASRSSTTPKRVSLSHDAPTTRTRTPRTVPAKLSSLPESDEMPGAFPDSPSMVSYPNLKQSLSKNQSTSTPRRDSQITPDEQEMHPQLHHQSTAKPREEARHLGFSNMHPHTEPPKQKGVLGGLQATPSRTRNLDNDLKSPSSSFQFTFNREHSLELSPEAKKLMHEQREKTALIREQMISSGEGAESIDQIMAARRIARPKGRFSQAHLKEFEKMESIAAHASASRAHPFPNRDRMATEKKEETKSLKRSPSKARLDEPDTPSSRPSSREGPKHTLSSKGSGLPRSTSTKSLKQTGPSPPTKRVKRAETDDVSAHHPPSSNGEKSLPSTPKRSESLASAPNNLAALTTPTQASLARAASVKSAKTSNIPAPQFTPAKGFTAAVPVLPAAPHFTPAKAGNADQHSSTPLLAKSPSKASLFATKPTVTAAVEQPSSMMSAAFARSPIKGGMFKKRAAAQDVESSPKEKPVPFLSRSPVKAPAAQPTADESSHVQKSTTPFLARSPTKLPMASTPVTETPDKTASNRLMGRFNLLRQSPMKSILRTPQRLYSEDPAKVAAGTHLATPPGKKAADLNKALPAAPHTVGNASKKVDFSSSTKARDQKSQERSSEESKTPTPSPKTERTVSMIPEVEPEAASYPQLPLEVPTYDRVPSLSPSPQKRRQTAGPLDFTFSAQTNGIVFGQSPNASASEAQRKRPSTIRHVSADVIPSPAPATGSKKRKFAFENNVATTAKDEIVSPAQGTKKRKFIFENKLAISKADDSDVEITSDKENTPVVEEADDDEQRPAKRVKTSAPSPKVVKKFTSSAATAPTAASAARRTTLGVKPKGTKTTSPVKKKQPATTAPAAAARPATTTISQSRLAALSQPKKRN